MVKERVQVVRSSFCDGSGVERQSVWNGTCGYRYKWVLVPVFEGWREQLLGQLHECNKVVGYLLQQWQLGVCPTLFQCFTVKYFRHICHVCCLFIIPICQSSSPLNFLEVVQSGFSIPFRRFHLEQQKLKLWLDSYSIVYAFDLRAGDLTFVSGKQGFRLIWPWFYRCSCLPSGSVKRAHKGTSHSVECVLTHDWAFLPT